MVNRWSYLMISLLLVISVSAMAADQKVIMAVKGMTCSLCTLAVEKSLSKTKGVTNVKVSYSEQQARFNADESVTDDTLIKAVQKAGYKGKVIERKPPQ